MDLRKVVFGAATVVLLLGSSALAATTYGLGRTPTAEELAASNITIQPDGRGLPVGHGDAKTGAQLFIDKGCSGCHGDAGIGGLVSAPELQAAKGPEADPWDRGVMAVKVPSATILFDFIRRAMPLGNAGSLTPDELYSLTAYLFAINKVIPDDAQLDQDSLPKVKTPMTDDKWSPVAASKADLDPAAPRFPGYPY
jgi:cytochrome c